MLDLTQKPSSQLPVVCGAQAVPSVCPVLADVFLSVVESLDSLPLPDAGPELPGEDVTGTGPEHPPAVLEAAAEASGVVVAVVVDSRPFPTLWKGQKCSIILSCHSEELMECLDDGVGNINYDIMRSFSQLFSKRFES